MAACSICTRPDVADINAELMAGTSPLALASKLEIPKSNLYRHRATCIREAIDQAIRSREEELGNAAIERFGRVVADTEGLYEAAINAKDFSLAARLLAQRLRQTEQQQRIFSGNAATVEIGGVCEQCRELGIDPREWPRVKEALQAVFGKHPDARRDLIAELESDPSAETNPPTG